MKKTWKTRDPAPGQPRRARIRPPPGAAPGTLITDPDAPRPVITVFAFGPDGFVEQGLERAEQAADYVGRWPVTWVNVDGLGDKATIETLSALFRIHPLAQEDIIYVHQRAKVETYQDNEFIVVRMVSLKNRIETEQVSFFLGVNYVLTFQERPGDCFDPVRERIRKGGVRLRSSGADYLAYCLLDSVVDAYYPLLEAYGERLDTLQDQVITTPDSGKLLQIHDARRDLRALRRAIWPLREVFNTLCRDPLPLVQGETRVFFRDCYDHTIQVVDLVETYREISSDLTDLYLSGLSNRMNNIMKVLTIIATIFMPLTFVAGIYGMNFNPGASRWNMPELNWKYGYFFSLALMLVSVIGMLVFFRRRGWIGARDAEPDDRRADDAQRAATGNHRLPPPPSPGT